MNTYVSDAETIVRQAEEIEELRAEVRRERERRILTALWGSRDEDCPRVFSIYRPEDAAAEYSLEPGILGYGCTFADGLTVVRSTGVGGVPTLHAYTSLEEFEDLNRPIGSYIAWLMEDLDDFTAAVTDAVERSFKNRAQTDSVRITVHHAVSAAVGDQLTWADCGTVTDHVLTALFGMDEQ